MTRVKESQSMFFLVPPLQVVELVYERQEECKKVGFSEFCRIYYKPKTINVEEEANITMKQVKTIDDAAKHIFA